MHYWGGKSFTARKIVGVMRPYIWGRRIIEPFCGALNITQHLQPHIASDINHNIIDMYEQWRAGWRPLPEITKEQYKEFIARDSFERGFYGAALSWGGQWCGSFINSTKKRDYLTESFNSLDKKINSCKTTEFLACEYDAHDIQNGDVIYCDPPYANTAQSYIEKSFDTKKFVQWIMDNRNKATFFVSEYNAPHPEFKEVWSRNMASMASSEKKKITEKLFMIGVD